MKENQVKNQVDAILWHLENKKTITSWEAIQEYGITRLADKILKLRRNGYIIESVPYKKITRFGTPTTISEYTLICKN